MIVPGERLAVHFAERNSRLTVQNAGQQPTGARTGFASIGNCLRRRTCSLDPIAPGESATIGASA